MDITPWIAQPLIRAGFKARNKAEALAAISDLAARSPLLQGRATPAALRQRFAEREAIVSTGVGNGVAIPHIRLPELDQFLVFFLVAPAGIDFEALDGKKVHIFFVVLAPEGQVNEHLKVLAAISFALSRTQLKREMLRATTPEILYEIVARNLRGEEYAATPAQRRKLLIVVLYLEERLNEILEFLIDHNIEGATILRSEGMGSYISSLPLFASFLDFMRTNKHMSHTILTLIPADEEAVLIQGIEALTGDLDRQQGAMLITLDIAYAKGSMTMF